MSKDKLFLLAPGFISQKQRQYCPECAEIWGLLHYFPAIKDTLDVVYQPLNKPRKQLVGMLGHEKQNCPTLILSDASPEFDDCGITQAGSFKFIDNARDIGRYYAQRFGTPFPR